MGALAEIWEGRGMEAATARFIEESTALPPAALAALYEDSLDRWSTGGRDASNATRVSASENSAIERAVRTALLRRTHELDAFRPDLCFDIKPACSIAARAVCKRTKLTEEQYRVLLDPFAAAGVTVPEW